jgi:LuxR family maltose regulon positive regulatory protein
MLVNGLAAVPHDLALILDDYHAIESEAVHATLAFLLEHLPPQMHLITASRTDPPLPLTRLLASGQLTNLTASDLRFTSEEASAFLNVAMGMELPAEDVTTLEEKTEGWIAGLQLAALSLRGREDASGFISAFSGTNRYVFDYLAEEVLDKQDEGTREFLLQTSILDRLSGPLCDAVTGRGEGQTKLEELERANLLITALDDERRWYRYHHLFWRFLREQLRRSHPELVPELHRRASAWHERNGAASEAISHAIAAGDFERAGALTEQLIKSMMGRGEIPAVERLMEALPEEILRSRPLLCTWYAAIVLMGKGQWDAAEAWLRDAERMLGFGAGSAEPAVAGDAQRTKETGLGNAAGTVVNAQATIAMERGNTRRAIALYWRALELLTDDELHTRTAAAIKLSECLLDVGDLMAADQATKNAIEITRMSGFPALTAWVLYDLGRLQAIQGRLSEAIKTYESVLRIANEDGEAGYLAAAGMAHVGMSELLLERNEPESAARHVPKGIELLLRWSRLRVSTSQLLEDNEAQDRLGRLEEVDAGAAHGVVTAYITLARARQIQGDTDGKLDALRKAEQVAQNSRGSSLWMTRTSTWSKAYRAQLWLAEGDLTAAKRWARERGLSPEDEIEYSPEAELERTTLARLLIAEGRHEEASELLERLLEAAEAGGRGRTEIEALALQAVALMAQDDKSGALAALRRALTFAEPEGYVRVFADEGKPMVVLLRRVLRAQRKEPQDVAGDVAPGYVGTLLEALGAEVATPARSRAYGTEQLILDPITGRELEVLKLLDTELSNREIATRLFISLATVKTHTKHLYRKLGVRARHQAVARGKDLGLL